MKSSHIVYVTSFVLVVAAHSCLFDWENFSSHRYLSIPRLKFVQEQPLSTQKVVKFSNIKNFRMVQNNYEIRTQKESHNLKHMQNQFYNHSLKRQPKHISKHININPNNTKTKWPHPTKIKTICPQMKISMILSKKKVKRRSCLSSFLFYRGRSTWSVSHNKTVEPAMLLL